MADWTPNHDWARALVNRQNTGTTTSSAMAVIGAGNVAKRVVDILKLINVDHIKAEGGTRENGEARGMRPFGQSPILCCRVVSPKAQARTAPTPDTRPRPGSLVDAPTKMIGNATSSESLATGLTSAVAVPPARAAFVLELK